MTDRLSQLLHDEAAALRPAAPDARSVLSDGRRLRRRQRVVTGLASAAAVAVVAVGVTAVVEGLGDDRRPEPAEIPRDAVIYGWRDQVHLGELAVTVPGRVNALDLTSHGLLVTSQTPDSLTLVHADGTTVDLGPRPGGPVVTDPDAAVFVHTERGTGSGRVVVVRDVETGQRVQELPAPEELGDARPGLSFDDGTVYLGTEPRGVFALDLASGDTVPLDLSTVGLPLVQAGRAVISDLDSIKVVDLASGETLLDKSADVYASLSADGRWFVVAGTGAGDDAVVDEDAPSRVEIYDLDTGGQRVQDEPYAGFAWGWTRLGHFCRVQDDSGDPVRPGHGHVRVDHRPRAGDGPGDGKLQGVPAF